VSEFAGAQGFDGAPIQHSVWLRFRSKEQISGKVFNTDFSDRKKRTPLDGGDDGACGPVLGQPFVGIAKADLFESFSPSLNQRSL
jgi:hypothetical protein